MAEVDQMISYLGLLHDDPVIEELLMQFSIIRTPGVEKDLCDEGGEIQNPCDMLSNLGRGIEFGFEDEAAFNGALPSEWGAGAMLLTQIYMYSNHSEAAAFEGALPLGLKHGDDREVVRAKLGSLSKECRSRHLDTWAFDKFMVTVGYLDDGLLSFVVLLCQPPRKAKDASLAAKCPTPNQLRGLLGATVNDAQCEEILQHLGCSPKIQQHGTEFAVMDLRESLGILLEFETSKDGPVLMRFQFIGDRRFGSAVWPGLLPNDLSFGDGWGDVLKKMGRPPDTESGLGFIFEADWVNGQYVNRIEYSTMTNEVLAVSVHGTLKEFT